MEGKTSKIEEKYVLLSEELKKQHLFLNEIKSALEKLENDKSITISNISKIEGAMQAYAETVKLLKEEPISGEIV